MHHAEDLHHAWALPARGQPNESINVINTSVLHEWLQPGSVLLVVGHAPSCNDKRKTRLMLASGMT